MLHNAYESVFTASKSSAPCVIIHYSLNHRKPESIAYIYLKYPMTISGGRTDYDTVNAHPNAS